MGVNKTQISTQLVVACFIILLACLCSAQDAIPLTPHGGCLWKQTIGAFINLPSKLKLVGINKTACLIKCEDKAYCTTANYRNDMNWCSLSDTTKAESVADGTFRFSRIMDFYECTGRKLSDPCNQVVGCIDENAECSVKTNTCVCNNTHYDDSGTCAEKKDLNASCSQTIECKGLNIVCSNKTNTCTCAAGYSEKVGKCGKDPIPMRPGDDTVAIMCRTNTANTPGTIAVFLKLKKKAMAIYAQNKPTSCGIGATAANKLIIADTNDTSAPFRYNFEVNTTNTNIATACGVKDGTENGNDKTSMVFFIVKTSGNKDIIIRDDGLYAMKCNWNKDKEQVIVTTPTKITVTGMGDSYMANKGVLDAILEVYSDNQGKGPQQKKSTVTLSDACSLRVTFNIDKQLVKRGKITDVMANYINDFTTKPLLLFGTDGCGIDASGVVQKANTFTPDSTFNKDNPTKYQYKSSDFSCFKFISGADTYYKANVVGCIDENDSTCVTPSCGGGRKKRSVDSILANRTDELIAMVRVVAELSKDQQNTKDSQLDAVHGTNDCLSNVSFMSVIVVLAVLLLLSLLMTVFFCVKLTRGQTPTKEGYPNLAYRS